jgi:hypothetical protein
MAANTTGAQNSGFGYGTLTTNTTGGYSTAVGYQALTANNGASNTAVGVAALDANTTGTQNTAVGRDALGASQGESNLTAIGFDAAKIANGATHLTAVGSKALDSLTTGNYNTALGYEAGGGINTGAGNTCVGYTAGDAITDYDYNICIGVGTDPGNDTGNSIVIGHDISIDGNYFAFGKASNYVYNGFTSNADWSRTSDERLKKNIATNTLGLSFINDLRPVTYNWKDSRDLDSSDSELTEHYDADENRMDSTTTFHGFIAQEVKTAMDNAGIDNFGGWNQLSSGVQGTSLEAMVTPLVKAVQELSAEVEELKSKLKE